MRNSGISSAITTAPSSAAPTRSQFALTGRSAVLDPRSHAVRPDLADVRLAAQVFAPHYAAPVARVVIHEVPLRAERREGEPIAMLKPGEAFELLDLAGEDGWGIATADGLVGYVVATALGQP